MLNNGAPRLSGEGEFVGYIASCVDISDRLSTERALRRSEARLQLATRVGSFGMWDINYQTEQVVWSDKLFEILGLEPRSLDPMTIDECRELASAAGADWLITEAADTSKQQSRERSFQSVSTGESRWIHYTSQLFF